MPYVLQPWILEILRLILAPLAGALAGAITAQQIARRNANIQRWQDELRATNAAVEAAKAIVGTAGAFKQQHVRSMKSDYDRQAAARNAFQMHGHGVFQATVDLQVLPPIRTAAPMLEKLIFERVSASPEVLGLFTIVVLSLDGLNFAIETRNTMIASLKARSSIPDEEIIDAYFGLVNASRHSDQTIPNALEAMAHQLDCVILYGAVLAHELHAHADALADRHRELQRSKRPNFGKMKREGIIPEITEIDRQAFEGLNVIPNLP